MWDGGHLVWRIGNRERRKREREKRGGAEGHKKVSLANKTFLIFYPLFSSAFLVLKHFVKVSNDLSTIPFSPKR